MKRLIRINLVPVGEVRRAGRRRLQRFVELVIVATTAFVLLALTGREWHTEAELRNRLRRLGGAVATGHPLATAEQPLQEEVEALHGKLSMLENIDRRNVSHESILRSISGVLPDSVWLTRFEISGDALMLEGRAKDHRLITRFLQELESLPHLVENQLIEVNQPKEVSDGGSTRFSTRSHILSGEATEGRNRESVE